MSEIRKNIRAGVFYTALAKYSNIVISILIGAVLARLLSPEEFGIVAIITVFISFFNLLSSFGFGAAIVQNQSLTDEDLSSIFSFTIVFGFVLSAIFFIGSPLISAFYGKEELTNLSRLMAVTILFYTFQIVPNALITKNLRFKEIGIISVIIHLITGAAAILLAYLGFSYYALIINGILNAVLLFIAYFFLAPVKLSFKIRLSSIRKIIKFSTYQFLFQFINYFAGNTDNLLIGKFFSASALGYYDKAYKLMLMPVQNLTFVITPVLHPVLSKFQNDKKIIYEAYYKIVKLLALIGFPLSIFLFFNAYEIVNIMYGPQWDQSIPVFKLLALAVGIQIVIMSSGSIFQATNRTDLLFYSGLLSTLLLVAGILYGIFIGKSLISIGYGILAALSINVFQAFYLVVKIALEQPYLKFIKLFIFPLLLTFGVGLTLWFASKLEIGGVVLSFTFKLFAAVLSYGILLYSSKENWIFLTENIKKLVKKNP